LVDANRESDDNQQAEGGCNRGLEHGEYRFVGREGREAARRVDEAVDVRQCRADDRKCGVQQGAGRYATGVSSTGQSRQKESSCCDRNRRPRLPKQLSAKDQTNVPVPIGLGVYQVDGEAGSSGTGV